MEGKALGFLLKALSRYGLPLPKGELVTDGQGARGVLLRLGGQGALRVPGRRVPCRNPEEGVALAEALLREGFREVLVEELVEVERTFSLSLYLLPLEVEVLIIVEDAPLGIRTEGRMDPLLGFYPYQGRKMALDLGLPSDLLGQFAEIVGKLYTLFSEEGLLRLEVLLGLTKRWTFVVTDVIHWEDPFSARLLALAQQGVDVVASNEVRAKGLVELLESEGVAVGRVLILPSRAAKKGTVEEVLRRGFQVIDPEALRNPRVRVGPGHPLEIWVLGEGKEGFVSGDLREVTGSLRGHGG